MADRRRAPAKAIVAKKIATSIPSSKRPIFRPTLFSIAGLDQPSAGTIKLGGSVFFDAARKLNLAPEQRNCGLVFQSYGLWPHMSVRANVEFPLKLRKIRGRAARDKADWALSLVEMQDFGERFPHELSGGQQQRVALARTLVYAPGMLLLDEPLSNLDAKLRLKITTLYVTHDQDEALALSDRIAVMDGGRIVQLGTQEDIYLRRPRRSWPILSATAISSPGGRPVRPRLLYDG